MNIYIYIKITSPCVQRVFFTWYLFSFGQCFLRLQSQKLLKVAKKLFSMTFEKQHLKALSFQKRTEIADDLHFVPI